jgi:hypothetical protein
LFGTFFLRSHAICPGFLIAGFFSSFCACGYPFQRGWWRVSTTTEQEWGVTIGLRLSLSLPLSPCL